MADTAEFGEQGYQRNANVSANFSLLMLRRRLTTGQFDQANSNVIPTRAILFNTALSLSSHANKSISIDEINLNKAKINSSKSKTISSIMTALVNIKSNPLKFILSQLTFRANTLTDLVPNLCFNFLIQPIGALLEYGFINAGVFLMQGRENKLADLAAATIGRAIGMPLYFIGATVGTLRKAYDGLINIPNLLIDKNRGEAGTKLFLKSMADLVLPAAAILGAVALAIAFPPVGILAAVGIITAYTVSAPLIVNGIACLDSNKLNQITFVEKNKNMFKMAIAIAGMAGLALAIAFPPIGLLATASIALACAGVALPAIRDLTEEPRSKFKSTQAKYVEMAKLKLSTDHQSSDSQLENELKQKPSESKQTKTHELGKDTKHEKNISDIPSRAKLR